MATKETIKATVEQLSVLYWLRLLDKMEVENATTLGEKYFCLSLDSIGIEQDQFDSTVTDLAKIGLLKEKQGEEYQLAFTDLGIAVADALESMDKLKAMGFRAVTEIKEFMSEHKDEIMRLFIAFGPTVIQLITK